MALIMAQSAEHAPVKSDIQVAIFSKGMMKQKHARAGGGQDRGDSKDVEVGWFTRKNE